MFTGGRKNHKGRPITDISAQSFKQKPVSSLHKGSENNHRFGYFNISFAEGLFQLIDL